MGTSKQTAHFLHCRGSPVRYGVSRGRRGTESTCPPEVRSRSLPLLESFPSLLTLPHPFAGLLGSSSNQLCVLNPPCQSLLLEKPRAFAEVVTRVSGSISHPLPPAPLCSTHMRVPLPSTPSCFLLQVLCTCTWVFLPRTTCPCSRHQWLLCLVWSQLKCPPSERSSLNS